MKKATNLMVLVAAMLTIISLVVPEVTVAQEEESTESEWRSGSGAFDGAFKFTGRTFLGARRGIVASGGMTFKGEKIPEMTLLGSFGVPLGSRQTTSFGLTYVIYPIKGKFGKLWGFGLEGGYYYKCDIDLVSIVKFRAPFTYLLKEIGANWHTQYWVATPLVEFSVPIGKKVRIGSKINPLGWGLWDYLEESKGYTHAKQWYDIDLYFSLNFGKK